MSKKNTVMTKKRQQQRRIKEKNFKTYYGCQFTKCNITSTINKKRQASSKQNKNERKIPFFFSLPRVEKERKLCFSGSARRQVKN